MAEKRSLYNLFDAGRAVWRWPMLEELFGELGFDVVRAKELMGGWGCMGLLGRGLSRDYWGDLHVRIPHHLVAVVVQEPSQR